MGVALASETFNDIVEGIFALLHVFFEPPSTHPLKLGSQSL